MSSEVNARSQASVADDARTRAIAVVVLCLISAGSFLYMALGRPYLPANFLGDGYLIQRIALERSGFVHDISYERTAAVYRYLQVADSPLLAGLLGYTAMVATVVLATRGRLSGLRHLATAWVATLCLALGAVYLGWYNKDFIVLAVMAGFVLQVRRSNPARRWYLTVIPMLAYAALFRPYWLVIAALFVGFYLAATYRATPSFWRLLLRLYLLSQLALMAIVIVFQTVTGRPITTVRSEANAERLGDPGAASAITPWLDTVEPLSTILNISLTQIALVLPWPLAATGEMRHLPYAAGIAVLWWSSAAILGAGYPSLSDSGRSAVQFATAFFVALITVQALFEPDFGSYLRHLTPTLPLLLAVLLTAGLNLGQSRNLAAISRTQIALYKSPSRAVR